MTTREEFHQQFFEMLMESQYWSREAMVRYQRGQLAQLLRDARANVPFYETRLDPVFATSSDIDWDRWSDIPIVKRSDLIEHREAMQTRMLPKGHGPVGSASSSGSTGQAVTIATTALAGRAYAATRWRAHRWHGLDWSKVLVSRMGDNWRPPDWPEGTPLGAWGPRWEEASRKGFAWSLNSKVPPDVLLDSLVEHRCSYLISGPKVGHLLALESRRLNKPVALEAILMQSGLLSADDRAICREVFGAPCIDHYGSKEGGQIAHECKYGSLHFNDEVNFVEVVDDEGRSCATGVAGRLVITPMFSTAQPLIRYEQGDIVVRGEACACGSTLPTIKTIVGRTLAIFRHPDGRGVVQIMPNESRETLQCEFWQMAQTGPNEYEIRYVPRDPDRQGDEAAFAREFQALYFDDARVSFRRVAEIPLTPSGKLLEYVNEYHDSTTRN